MLFRSIPDADDSARALAEQQAAAMRGEVPSGPDSGLGALGSIQFVGGTPADLPPDKRAKLETMLGVDLDGDGVIGMADQTAAPATSGQAEADDRLEQLERLARLRDSGAVTQSEFDAEKRRLLGS